MIVFLKLRKEFYVNYIRLKNAIVVFPQNQNKSASLNVRHFLHVHVHLFDTTERIPGVKHFYYS